MIKIGLTQYQLIEKTTQWKIRCVLFMKERDYNGVNFPIAMELNSYRGLMLFVHEDHNRLNDSLPYPFSLYIPI